MDRLEAVMRQVEALSARELAEFREWFYDYLDDLATAERRFATRKSGESETYSMDEVERLLSLDEAGSTTDVVGKK